MGTIVDCHWPHRPDAETRRHACSSQLTDAEILERFGLVGSRAVVTVWPSGRPDQARVIHRPAGNTELEKGEQP